MKKVILFVLLIMTSFTLFACSNEPAPEPELLMRVQDGVIQYSEDGENWRNLVTVDELSGEDGSVGEDGVSIVDATVNSSGELVLTYSDGSSENLGVITGSDGTDGEDGEDGAAGANAVSISSAALNAEDELVITYTDETTVNLGVIRGPEGVEGETGDTAYEVYIRYNEYFTKSEAEWLTDLVEGRLSDSETLDVMTVSDLEAVSATTATAVKLQSNITGSVVLANPLNIDFNGYSIVGDLTINGAATLDAVFEDSYDNTGTITGDLTIDAPNLTLTNEIDIDGELTINQISMASYNGSSNISGGVILAGPARLNLSGDASSADVTINTTRSVILAGTFNGDITADVTGVAIQFEDKTVANKFIMNQPGQVSFLGTTVISDVAINAVTGVAIERDDEATLTAITGAGKDDFRLVRFVTISFNKSPSAVDIDLSIMQIEDYDGNSITPVAVSPFNQANEVYRLLAGVDYEYVVTLSGNSLITSGGVINKSSSGVQAVRLDPVTVKEVLDMDEDLPVYFEAIVSGYRAFSGNEGFFVQDLNTAHAIFVFEDFTSTGPGVEVGNTVELYGNTNLYTTYGNQLKQVTDVTLVDNLEDTQTVYVVNDVSFEDALMEYPTNAAVRYEFTNLTISSIANNSFYFESSVSTLPTLRIDYRNYAMHLRDVYQVGDVVETLVVNFYDLYFDDVRGEAADVPLTEAQLEAIALDELSLSGVTTQNVTLPAVLTVSGMEYQGGSEVFTITYTSDSAQLDESTGVVSLLPFDLTPASITVTATLASDLFDPNVTVDLVIEVGNSAPPEPVLIISEYIEGSSYNKAIEITNPTMSTESLTGYTVELYFNGNSSAGSTIDLSTIQAELGPRESIVIYNSSASQLIKDVGDQTSGVANFNGDDAIALLRNDVVVDVFGVIGVDPGSNWPVGDDSTADHTLVRSPLVTGPSATWNEAEWTSYPQDTFDYLGYHDVGIRDLFISEYIEGSSFNKAIEIYNASTNAITLSGYTVELYTNGSSSAGSTIDLSTIQAELGPRESIVIYNTQASQLIKDVGDQTSGVANFNGDDALALIKDGVVIDQFGIIGVDPGSRWDVGEDSTADHTLVRKGFVNAPSAVWNPDEWIAYPQDTFDYLGSHVETYIAERVTDADRATTVAAGLTLPTTTSTNLTLPTTGLYDATITWSSNTPDVISNTGQVTQPAVGAGDVNVTLTAIITIGDATETKTFMVTVEEKVGRVIDLFISEYIEGSPGNRKAIEIYNPTDNPITLDGTYSIALNSNSNTTWSSPIQLQGTIQPGQVFVIFNDDSADNQYLGTFGDLETSSLSHNGDDAIGLFKDGELLDIFGVFGEDPGDGWTINGISDATKDKIITRSPSVNEPSNVWIISEWIIESDYSDGGVTTLGSHSVD